jgi:hypothetical protein
MKAQQASLRIIWHMVRWGVVLGALLGALFPFLAAILTQSLMILSGGDAGATSASMFSAWVVVGCGVGFAAGGISGIFIGVITGVVLAVMTYWAFRPIIDFRRYRHATEITSIVVGGAGALLLVVISGLLRSIGSGWGGEWGWFVWGVFPVLIATAATWWAGRRLSNYVSAPAPETG